MHRVELIGTHGADGNVDRHLRPAGALRNPAAVGASDLEVVAVHVDRMVGHGQVAGPDPHPVTLIDHQRVDVREDPAVPAPQVEIRHLHHPRHIGAGVDVEGVQHDQEIPVDGHEGGVLGMHDEHPHHAHRHLHHLIAMRVVHEGAGFDQVELIDKGLAGRDARMAEACNPVHAGGQDQPVPMHRGMLRQLVGHINPHPVALHRLDGGAGGLAVVAPQVSDHAVGQLALDRLGHQVEFLHPVVHPERQGPAVQRDHRVVVRPSGWGQRRLGRRAVHAGGLGQAHVHGLAPGLAGHQRSPRRAGPKHLTSVHHVI
ncbi:hypothetical protein PHA8399_01511 [Leisingera aquaemixtae]|uniref:Uncharacterized protein n=1 Tax=Leisingera aquaemixtae TaxID=1396826 RepID=A0A0P1H7V9_9RHOB|nr:hypothetical protein PHA8399_01511 [Leisingera aquaemixtae]